MPKEFLPGQRSRLWQDFLLPRRRGNAGLKPPALLFVDNAAKATIMLSVQPVGRAGWNWPPGGKAGLSLSVSATIWVGVATRIRLIL